MPRWREHRVRRRGNAGRAGDGRGSLALPARTVVRALGGVCVRRALCSSSARWGFGRGVEPASGRAIDPVFSALGLLGVDSKSARRFPGGSLPSSEPPRPGAAPRRARSAAGFSGQPLGLGWEPGARSVGGTGASRPSGGSPLGRNRKPSGKGHRSWHGSQPLVLGAAVGRSLVWASLETGQFAISGPGTKSRK